MSLETFNFYDDVLKNKEASRTFKKCIMGKNANTSRMCKNLTNRRKERKKGRQSSFGFHFDHNFFLFFFINNFGVDFN